MIGGTQVIILTKITKHTLSHLTCINDIMQTHIVIELDGKLETLGERCACCLLCCFIRLFCCAIARYVNYLCPKLNDVLLN
jgi:hypothetical protein